MNEGQKTQDVFLEMLISLTQAADHRNDLQDCIYRDAKEIEKLNSIIDELRDENERLKQEAKGGEA
jgi:dephospho-CoA kinase